MCVLHFSAENIEVRLTPSLWPLHDALIPASLHFSMLHLRNAAPRVGQPLTPGL